MEKVGAILGLPKWKITEKFIFFIIILLYDGLPNLTSKAFLHTHRPWTLAWTILTLTYRPITPQIKNITAIQRLLPPPSHPLYRSPFAKFSSPFSGTLFIKFWAFISILALSKWLAKENKI